MRGVRRSLAALGLTIAGAPAAALGQIPKRAAGGCDGKIVASITVTARDPSLLAAPKRLRPLARWVGLVDVTTTPATITSFLLLAAGQPCTEQQRAESERILRLQPFLAAATVRAVPDDSGRVRIEVETIDEIPTVIEMRFQDSRPSEVRLGNNNIAGQGLYLAASVERGLGYRDGAGVYAVARQIYGKPYMIAIVAKRAPLGGEFAAALGHAFLTDLQRTAWHVGVSDANRYESFIVPDGDAPSIDIRRQFWDAGGVRRIGVGRHIAFFGVLLTHENVTSSNRLVVISDSGLVPLGRVAFADSTVAYRNLRTNAVAGIRALSFMPVRGFDALSATQDVASGVQFGALAGRTIPYAGSGGGDIFVSTDFYAGVGSVTSFSAVRIESEGRRDLQANDWDSMVASGRIAWYLKPATAHVVISSVEFGGGWRDRVPFQLALGDLQGGVRGYGASRDAGAVRAVTRLEERWSIGRLTSHDAVGLASFVDAGRVWAGDAPFGVSSRTKVGIGASLLAAFPPESQRLWRLDLAIPVSPDAPARWEVRLTGIWTRTFWREPDDVARGRAGAAPSTIFTWP
ncbi:MAG TPA: hypothetical protein VHV78_01550 [Gemmatimonadaceae bacterium]|nr:hypothetical protein [Gemmatimonadaceae bacterium]